MEVLYGLHPVEEALKSGKRRFDHVLVARERHDSRLARLVAQCSEIGVRILQEPREQLTLTAKTPAHQGVVAFVRPQELASIEDLLAPPAASPAARLILALDGIEDPQNLGALLRVADGAGVDGVILTKRRSAPLSPAAVKASAGAAEHLRIVRVVNLVRALEDLKTRNLWIVGLDERGPTHYDQFDFTGDLVIVLGREARACTISSAAPATTSCAFPWPEASVPSTSPPPAPSSFSKPLASAALQCVPPRNSSKRLLHAMPVPRSGAKQKGLGS